MLSVEVGRLKKKIKNWEYSFFAEHGRDPSANDIRAEPKISTYS